MATSLVYFNRRDHHKTIPVESGNLIIGRRPDCDIQIPDLLVSRQHCRIIRNDHGFFIQDLSTPNGTYVNQKRIDKAELIPGDVIQIGPIQFTVQIDGQPANIKPPSDRAKKAKGDSFSPPSTSKKPKAPPPAPSSSDSDILGSEILAELGLDPDD